MKRPSSAGALKSASIALAPVAAGRTGNVTLWPLSHRTDHHGAGAGRGDHGRCGVRGYGVLAAAAAFWVAARQRRLHRPRDAARMRPTALALVEQHRSLPPRFSWRPHGASRCCAGAGIAIGEAVSGIASGEQERGRRMPAVVAGAAAAAPATARRLQRRATAAFAGCGHPAGQSFAASESGWRPSPACAPWSGFGAMRIARVQPERGRCRLASPGRSATQAKRVSGNIRIFARAPVGMGETGARVTCEPRFRRAVAQNGARDPNARRQIESPRSVTRATALAVGAQHRRAVSRSMSRTGDAARAEFATQSGRQRPSSNSQRLHRLAACADQ